MKSLDFWREALCGCMAVATLASCALSPSPSMGQGGIGLPMGAPGATSQRATTPKPDSLIYISDEGSSDVYVYSLSKGTHVATLAGFSEPRGICLDKAGDVWITNAGASDLLEYAPGGTEPIASLNDPGEYPVDCSVETTTGDLGVANIISAKYGSGSLSLYNGAGDVPAIVGAFNHTSNDVYDPAGNLFVEGASNLGAFQLGELARGQKAVTNLTIKGAAITQPLNLQYADGHLAIGDERSSGGSVIYRLAVSGTTARVVGTTHLRGANFITFFILGRQVFCLNSAYQGVRVAIYNYPAGGKAIRVIKLLQLSIPTSLAVTTVAN